MKHPAWICERSEHKWKVMQGLAIFICTHLREISLLRTCSEYHWWCRFKSKDTAEFTVFSMTFIGKWVDHNLACQLILSISIPSTNILQYSMRVAQSSHPLLLFEIFCIAAVVLAEPAISFTHNVVCLPDYKNSYIYPAFTFVSKLEGMEVNCNHTVRYVVK